MRARLDLSPLPRLPAPELDPEQRQVVEHRDGPLLVLAGPGTGKTTTIVESVVGRLAHGELPADSILVLTFGRRAAGELRDRIAARLGGGVLPQIATFHSFAYSLLRASASAEEYADPPRLLSGAEEDQRIRELIRGTLEDGSVQWPTSLGEALETHGFAVEVRTLIARMRERDISPARLRTLAAKHERPEWSAVADIAEQEADVMVLQNVLDYAELMRRAVLRAQDADVRADIHGRIRAIYVDEFQDTDPLQVELLRAIVGPGCSVVAVGDPDQAIYAFRGTDVRGILDFPEIFPDAAGHPARIVALRNVRRFGPHIAAAATGALAPALLPGLPVDVQRDHRTPHLRPDRPLGGENTKERVRILQCGSRASRDAHVAQLMRAAHVHDGCAWRDMAVLARTSEDLVGIERALNLAGVPATITADEIPLRDETAVAQILTVLDIAAEPERARTEQVLDVLSGPIGRLDASGLRTLGRALRQARRDAGDVILPARELIRELIVGSEPLPPRAEPDTPLAESVARVQRTVQAVSAQITAGAPIAEVLWTAWTGGATPHGWPERLRQAALSGSRSADHDLDAVIALFDAAERISERYRGVYGVASFVATLRDQSIPAEAIADSGDNPHHDRVRVMTVHRAKGLQWNRVWVVGLEEGRWPNIQLRGSLLGVQELQEVAQADAPTDPVAALIREERNLLYVACTRACEELTLLCVDSGETGDDRPSRFVADLVANGVELDVVADHPDVVASWPALVADLRRSLLDESTPALVRDQAAALLAAASRLRDASQDPIVPAADPDRWWGVRELSRGPLPLRAAGEPIALSGSSVDTLRQCSMKWFLDHEVHAETMRLSSTAFGSIVHAIADHVAKGDIPAEIDVMDEFVDRVWSTVEFEARWRSASERTEARRSLERFLRYHLAAVRELVDSERYLQFDVPVVRPDASTEEVTIRGYIDRIERDSEGRLFAVDLKTTASVPTKAETEQHGQLGLYQLLLREDYRADASGEDVGGAALVQLRKDAGAKDPGPKEQVQAPLSTDGEATWIETALGQAAQVIRDEDITAHVGKQCTYCAFAALCPAKNSHVSLIELTSDAHEAAHDDTHNHVHNHVTDRAVPSDDGSNS